MTMPDDPNRFTDEQKRELCLMISIGCDRKTACDYLGKTAEQLRVELQREPSFRKQFLHAEATPEFNHLRNLYLAAKEAKNWRASVWWLERRAPERYARRAPNTITHSQVRQVFEELAETLVSEVENVPERHRLLSRLVQSIEKVSVDSLELPEDLPARSAENARLLVEQDNRTAKSGKK